MFRLLQEMFVRSWHFMMAECVDDATYPLENIKTEFAHAHSLPRLCTGEPPS